MAFVWCPKLGTERRLVTSVNWSPGIVNPFRRLGERGRNLDAVLARLYCGDDEEIVVFMHLVTPLAQFFGPANVPDVWQVKKVNPQSMIHLTQKPVELAVRAIQYSSRAGENVLDLFGGSGSTLFAAEQAQRRAFLMEIDPAYRDVVVQMWEGFSGRKAERVDAGGRA